MDPYKIQQLATPQFATNSVYGQVPAPAPVATPAPNPTMTSAAAATAQAPTAAGGETYAQILARQANVGKPGYDVFGNPVSAEVTAGAIAGGMTQKDFGGISQSDAAYNNSVTNPFTSPTTTPEQEATIRQNTMLRFQSEIDNTNRYYNELLAKAAIEGKNLLGQSSAIQARRGMLGSNVGAAIDEKTTQYNRSQEASIVAQRDSAINSIMTSGAAAVNDDIRLAREAASKGFEAWQNHLAGKQTRETARATTAAKALLAQGVDPSSDSAILKQVADAYQIDPATVLSAYHDENLDAKTQALKDAYTKAETDALAIKNRYQNVTDGAQVLDLVTGKIIASNAKDFAPKAAGGSGGGGSVSAGQFKSDLDALAGRVRSAIVAKNQREAFDAALSSARNEDDKLRTIAANVTLPAQIRADINMNSQALPSIDQAISLVKNGAKTGFLQSKKEYVYDVMGKNYDPELTQITQFLTAAKQRYRNAVTGAAWGAQEEAEYNSLFGSTKYTPEDLLLRLEGVKKIFRTQILSALQAAADPLSMGQGPIGSYQAPQAATAVPTTAENPLGI